MKKVLTWIVRLAVLVVLVKVVMWSWEQYQAGGKGTRAADVPAWNRDCHITNPDYGSCVCFHRDTNERLDVPHEECLEQARNKR